MKIVIDIEEEVYNRIKGGCPEPNDCFECQDGVLYGTPIVNGNIDYDTFVHTFIAEQLK